MDFGAIWELVDVKKRWHFLDGLGDIPWFMRNLHMNLYLWYLLKFSYKVSWYISNRKSQTICISTLLARIFGSPDPIISKWEVAEVRRIWDIWKFLFLRGSTGVGDWWGSAASPLILGKWTIFGQERLFSGTLEIPKSCQSAQYF